MGFFAGLITYILLGYGKFNLLLSILCGALFSILLLTYFLIYLNFYTKKYTEFEKTIISPVFYKTNGNFNVSNGKVKNGNIYFCESGIVCVCIEEKPYAIAKILVEDIENITYDTIHLTVTTKDGLSIYVTLSDINDVVSALKNHNWIT